MSEVSTLDLLEQLKRLPPPIFNEVIFRLRVSAAALPGVNSTQTDRAMALIQLMEMAPGGIEQLQAVVRDRVAASLGGAPPTRAPAPVAAPPVRGPRLSASDRATLRDELCAAIQSRDAIREVIDDAELKAVEIDLGGTVKSQWHNTLDYADSHGSAALARLLSKAAALRPGLWDRVGGLLAKYGVPGRPEDAGVGNVHANGQPKRTVILFVASVPEGSTPLRITQEVGAVFSALWPPFPGASYELAPALERPPRDLGELIRQVSSGGKRVIFHCSGHATASGLVMENADGNRVVVKIATLVGIFKQWSNVVDLVVLNACETLKAAEAISQVVACTIGTTDKFKEKSAQVFSPVFYRALASGASVASAFEEARLAVDAEGHGQGDTLKLLYRPG